MVYLINRSFKYKWRFTCGIFRFLNGQELTSIQDGLTVRNMCSQM